MIQFESLSLIIWICFIILSIIFSIFISLKFFNKKKPLEPAQRDYFLGMVIFIIIHSISRILYMLYDFYLIGGDHYQLFWDMAAVVGIGSVIALLFAIERHIIKKTKYLFTILSSITLILFIVLPEYKETIQLFMIPIVAVIIPFIYFYTAIKTSGEIRRTSLIIGIGIIIFILGQAAHSINVWDLFAYEIAYTLYYFASPIGLIIGGILLFYGLMKT
ncbi:MAG: hypothetical protein ACTSPY_01220 [Candidatus Helarchaeota archaeon]